MEVIQMNIDSIIPYDNNPRNNEDAVQPVANSIKEFGFQQPIVVDKNNVVIVGHTRLQAAKSLGMTEVPVVVADLDADKAKEYRLADNKTGELAGWDFQKLEEELSGIEDDMKQFGFEDDSKDDMSQFFQESDQEGKKPEMITCPYCGKQFEKE